MFCLSAFLKQNLYFSKKSGDGSRRLRTAIGSAPDSSRRQLVVPNVRPYLYTKDLRIKEATGLRFPSSPGLCKCIDMFNIISVHPIKVKGPAEPNPKQSKDNEENLS